MMNVVIPEFKHHFSLSFLKYLTDQFRKKFEKALNNSECQSSSKAQSMFDGIGFLVMNLSLFTWQQKPTGAVKSGFPGILKS